jgi:hypothetical protein
MAWLMQSNAISISRYLFIREAGFGLSTKAKVIFNKIKLNGAFHSTFLSHSSVFGILKYPNQEK